MPSNSTRWTTERYANLCEKWSRCSVPLIGRCVLLQSILLCSCRVFHWSRDFCDACNYKSKAIFITEKGRFQHPNLISFTLVWKYNTWPSPLRFNVLCDVSIKEPWILKVEYFSYINNSNKLILCLPIRRFLLVHLQIQTQYKDCKAAKTSKREHVIHHTAQSLSNSWIHFIDTHWKLSGGYLWSQGDGGTSGSMRRQCDPGMGVSSGVGCGCQIVPGAIEGMWGRGIK